MQDYNEMFSSIEDEKSEEKPKFSITDDNLADWAICKIADEKAECDRLVSACEYKIQLFEEKIQKYREQFESKTSYLKFKLMEYFDKVPHKSTKTQETYKLPSGTLKRKFEKQDYSHDDEKLVKWLKENMPEMITEKPMWGEFKKTLQITDDKVIIKETGELVDGVTVETKPSEFIVSPDAGAF